MITSNFWYYLTETILHSLYRICYILYCYSKCSLFKQEDKEKEGDEEGGEEEEGGEKEEGGGIRE